jgi:glycosyltransferase involved in cell wall biosynthesis
MHERPRVVHVIVAGDIGGAERFLVELAGRPRESGADHSIALMTPNRKLAALFVDAGLRVHDRGHCAENPVAFLRRSFGHADVAWVEAVLRSERADIAHLHTFGAHVVGTRAARRAGVRILRTEHHMLHYTTLDCAPFTRWGLPHTDWVVAVSGWVRDYIATKVPSIAPRMSVVLNGIDTERFAFREAPPDDRPFTFVVTCRLEDRKQVHLAIEAMASVPGAVLEIVGDGAERSRLEELARARGVADRVNFRGFLADPREALASADVALSCSRDEGLPLAVLEALATGRTVIATPVGGVPEVVVDGEWGWLVEQTPAAFAARMRDAMADRSRIRRMGERARRYVHESCRIEAMCEGYGRVYRNLVASSPIAARGM